MRVSLSQRYQANLRKTLRRIFVIFTRWTPGKCDFQFYPSILRITASVLANLLLNGSPIILPKAKTVRTILFLQFFGFFFLYVPCFSDEEKCGNELTGKKKKLNENITYVATFLSFLFLFLFTD